MADPGQIEGYELKEWLGDGAWSAIYAAHQISLDRPVIVKIMRPEIAADEAEKNRILGAARQVARISDRHLVCGLDVGEDAGRPYFVMERVDGTSVEDHLRARKRLPERQCLRLCARIARALHAVHGGLMVHRGVRPRSMLVTRHGLVKLTDLGAASLESARDLADEGQPSSAWYTSPELADGSSEGDAASDLYALGVSLFQMLSGQPPFDGETREAVLARHRLSLPPALRTLLPGVSLATEEIVKRCLAKRASDRYLNGNELADALDRVAERLAAVPKPVVKVAKSVQAKPDPAPGDAQAPAPTSTPAENPTSKTRPAQGQVPLTRRTRRRRRR